MNKTALKLYALDYSQLKTYLFASAFVMGNLLFPQLCHLISQGGFIFLPIYFFTLIAAYKYGWKVGLLTAILSPIMNHLLFGMPMATFLPVILVKSLFLAFIAAFAAQYFKRLSLPILLGVILSYQLLGSLIEWCIVGDFFVAVQDFRIGIPGMILQLFGGYFFINFLIRK